MIANDYLLISEKYTEVRDVEQLKKDFEQVGHEQRGRPESVMLKWQHALGGGVLSYIVEHIGDLSHRASLLTYSGDPLGYEYVNEKVNGTLRTLTRPYGFERERLENLRSNAVLRYLDKHPDEKLEFNQLERRIGNKDEIGEAAWDNAIDARNTAWHTLYHSSGVAAEAAQMDVIQRRIGKEYAEAHRTEVHPLTVLQRLGQQAAISVGMYRWDDAIYFLTQIQNSIKACGNSKAKLNALYFKGYTG